MSFETGLLYTPQTDKDLVKSITNLIKERDRCKAELQALKTNNLLISKKKAEQFNAMLKSLRKIYKEYMSPEQMRKHEDADFHGFDEFISMSYDNIQSEARFASKGVQPIDLTEPKQEQQNENTN